MAQVTSVTMTDNSEEVKAASVEKIQAWLDAIGEDAASTAADKAPVDTGRLKNSISHAVDMSDKSVYIGTNVHDENGHNYAIYQEFGTSRGIVGKHFIQFGASAHTAEYQRLLARILKEE
jgi:hypothetical protein